MTRSATSFLTFALVVGFAQESQLPPNPDIHYRLGPDSLAQEGVPKGEIRGPFTLPSKAWEGTQHTYWVYVPAQYDSSVPASLMIFNDGQAYMAPEADLRAIVCSGIAAGPARRTRGSSPE